MTAVRSQFDDAMNGMQMAAVGPFLLMRVPVEPEHAPSIPAEGDFAFQCSFKGEQRLPTVFARFGKCEVEERAAHGRAHPLAADLLAVEGVDEEAGVGEMELVGGLDDAEQQVRSAVAVYVSDLELPRLPYTPRWAFESVSQRILDPERRISARVEDGFKAFGVDRERACLKM